MLSMNQLYPIFLKTESLQFLIVGGGHVALEKLEFLLGAIVACILVFESVLV